MCTLCTISIIIIIIIIPIHKITFLVLELYHQLEFTAFRRSVTGTARKMCGARSMQRHGVRPSVRLSVCFSAAAEEQLDTVRSQVARDRSTALSNRYGQCHAYSQVTRPNTDLLQLYNNIRRRAFHCLYISCPFILRL